VIALYGPYQNIGIDENRHLPAIGTKVLAAERFIRDGSGFREAVGPLFKLRRPLLRAEPKYH
jgi:hypothetical protein